MSHASLNEVGRFVSPPADGTAIGGHVTLYYIPNTKSQNSWIISNNNNNQQQQQQSSTTTISSNNNQQQQQQQSYSSQYCRRWCQLCHFCWRSVLQPIVKLLSNACIDCSQTSYFSARAIKLSQPKSIEKLNNTNKTQKQNQMLYYFLSVAGENLPTDEQSLHIMSFEYKVQTWRKNVFFLLRT